MQTCGPSCGRILSDPDSHTIDAFGIRNKDVPAGSPQDGIRHPVTFLIGQDGVILAKLFHLVLSPRELIETSEELRDSAAAK